MNILVMLPQGIKLQSFIPPNVKNMLASMGNVEYNLLERDMTKEEVKSAIVDKDVIITGWGTIKIDNDMLKSAKNLKIVAHTGGSVAPVVCDEVYEKGIMVLSGNEMYAESVAEAVIAYALAALRKIPDYCAVTKEGGWYKKGEIWEGLLEQCIGIVGYGMTSKYLVKMLSPFRPELYVYSSHLSQDEADRNNLKKASLDEIFSECKIITLHSAMTPKNYHMVDRRLLEMLKKDSLLINTARGGLIDTDALTALLSEGRFRAVLDVFEEEPLPVSHPLRSCENAYILPHMAGPTYDRRKYVTMALIEDIKSYFEGRPVKLGINKTYAGHMTC